MYELLLEWGLESLRKVAITKSDQELTVLLEAIKAKNALVLERFRYAWTSCQAVVDLGLSVEEALPEFLKEASKTDSTVEGARKFMGVLKAQFHPQFYRRLKKIRYQFDATNDILSAYSTMFASIVHFSTSEEIAIQKNLVRESDLVRLYRGLWSFYSRTMTSLVRVTSSDLRFWLTDQPYIAIATTWAHTDLERSMEWLKLHNNAGKAFYLSLETPEGLQDFWTHMNNT